MRLGSYGRSPFRNMPREYQQQPKQGSCRAPGVEGLGSSPWDLGLKASMSTHVRLELTWKVIFYYYYYYLLLLLLLQQQLLVLLLLLLLLLRL